MCMCVSWCDSEGHKETNKKDNIYMYTKSYKNKKTCPETASHLTKVFKFDVNRVI